MYTSSQILNSHTMDGRPVSSHHSDGDIPSFLSEFTRYHRIPDDLWDDLNRWIQIQPALVQVPRDRIVDALWRTRAEGDVALKCLLQQYELATPIPDPMLRSVTQPIESSLLPRPDTIESDGSWSVEKECRAGSEGSLSRSSSSDTPGSDEGFEGADRHRECFVTHPPVAQSLPRIRALDMPIQYPPDHAAYRSTSPSTYDTMSSVRSPMSSPYSASLYSSGSLTPHRSLDAASHSYPPLHRHSDGDVPGHRSQQPVRLYARRSSWQSLSNSFYPSSDPDAKAVVTATPPPAGHQDYLPTPPRYHCLVHSLAHSESPPRDRAASYAVPVPHRSDDPPPSCSFVGYDCPPHRSRAPPVLLHRNVSAQTAPAPLVVTQASSPPRRCNASDRFVERRDEKVVTTTNKSVKVGKRKPGRPRNEPKVETRLYQRRLAPKPPA